MGQRPYGHLIKEDPQMANKRMRRCSTSCIIREIQIKTTMRHHYTPIKMAKIRNTDNTKCWRSCGATGILTHCRWECRMARPRWKMVWQFLIKLNILLLHDSTSLVFDPMTLKIYVHTKIRMWTFTAVLFIIVKTWKQPRCPSVGDRQINCGPPSTKKKWAMKPRKDRAES